MNKNNNKPKCSNCQSGWVYTKEDGMRVCRTCGHREVVKPEKKKDGNSKQKRK